MYVDMPCLPLCYRVKTTPVPENLFQCQIFPDNLHRVPDYFDTDNYELKHTIS